MRTPVVFLLLLLLAIAAPAGADPSFGLAVGEKAPEFELTDQKGEAHTLSSLLSRGKLAIVFYRSADW